MNYYPHHIGDYLKDTAHLTMIEDGAYRRLMDLYYQHEEPLPLDKKQIYRLCRAISASEKRAINTILDEYFCKSDSGYHHKRCDQEINVSREKSNKAKASAASRWNKKTHSERNANAYANASSDAMRRQCERNANPITNNQKPIKEAAYIPPPESREATPESPPPDDEKPENPPSPATPDDAPARATQIAVLLRRNGADARIHPASKGIAELIAAQATDAQVLTALETALKRRKEAGSTQPVTAAYLVPIVAELQQPPPEKPTHPPRDDWWKSNNGIDRKAREMGLYARGGEDYASFKDRIFDEIRARQATQGATP